MRSRLFAFTFLLVCLCLASVAGCVPESQAAHCQRFYCNGIPARNVLTTRYGEYTAPPDDEEPEAPAERVVHLNPGGAYGAPAAPNLPSR